MSSVPRIYLGRNGRSAGQQFGSGTPIGAPTRSSVIGAGVPVGCGSPRTPRPVLRTWG